MTTTPDVGSKLQFKATGNYSDGINRPLSDDVTWNSDQANVLGIDPETGLATAKDVGTPDISATQENVTGHLITSIAAPNVATLLEIKITPSSVSLASGLTQQLKVTGYYSYGQPRDLTAQITWSVNNTNATVNQKTGLVYAASRGSSVVTATYGNKTATANINITSSTLTSISVSPSGKTLAAGQTQQYTATATYSDGTTRVLAAVDGVQWSSSDTSYAIVNTTTGLVSASSLGALDPGTTEITAKYQGLTASETLTVTKVNQLPEVTLTRVYITPDYISVPVGTTINYIATGIYSDGVERVITSGGSWSLSNSTDKKYAQINSQTGEFKALAYAGPAYAVSIIFKIGSIEGRETLVIKQAGDNTTTPSDPNSGPIIGGGGGSTTNPPGTTSVLQSIVVLPDNSQIKVNGNKQFKIKAKYADGTSQTITNGVAWKATGDATISSSGIATGTKLGSAVITATFQGKTDTANLRVTNNTLQSITVDPAYSVVDIGDTLQFIATALYRNDDTGEETQEVLDTAEWSSSDASVASINSSGLATGIVAGDTTITASFDSLQATTSLGVRPELINLDNLVELQVLPSNITLKVGDEKQFQLYGKFRIAEQEYVFRKINSGESWTITWSLAPYSSIYPDMPTGDLLATIDSEGKVTATDWAKGTDFGMELTPTIVNASLAYSTINPATSNGLPLINKTLSGSNTFNTVSNEIMWLSVSPTLFEAIAARTVQIGNTLQFEATASYADGTTKLLTPDDEDKLEWKSTAPGFATIDKDTGLATGIAVGAYHPAVADTHIGGVVIPGHAAYYDKGYSQIKVKPKGYTDQEWASREMIGSIQKPLSGSESEIYVSKDAVVPPPKQGPQGLVSVVIVPAMPVCEVGETWEFTAIGTFDDGRVEALTEGNCSPYTLKWTSSNTSVGGIEQSTGIGQSLSVGTTIITFQVGDFIATTTAAVVGQDELPQILLTINRNPAVDETATLTATGFEIDSDLLGQIIWTSSNNNIATVVKGTTSTTEAKATVSRHDEGLVTITVQIPVRVNGQVFNLVAEKELEVGAPDNSREPESFAFNPASVTMSAGETKTVTTTITYKDGTTGPIPADSGYSISIDDTSIATFAGEINDDNGNVAAIKIHGVADGNTNFNISFSYIPAGSSTPVELTFSCPVQVVSTLQFYVDNTPVTGESVTYNSTDQEYLVKIGPGINQNVTWTVNGTAITSSSPSGLNRLATVVSPGTLLLYTTYQTEFFGGYYDRNHFEISAVINGQTMNLTIDIQRARTYIKTQIMPQSVNLISTQTQQFNVVNIYSDLTTENVPSGDFTWSDPYIENSIYPAFVGLDKATGLVTAYSGTTFYPAVLKATFNTGTNTIKDASVWVLDTSTSFGYGTTFVYGLGPAASTFYYPPYGNNDAITLRQNPTDTNGDSYNDKKLYFLKANYADVTGQSGQAPTWVPIEDSVSWYSYNPEICLVDGSGNLTAVSSGVANIIAVAVRGSERLALRVRVFTNQLFE